MILVFLGPPGSGKGTQAKRLSSQRSWPQLSTGDMLRAAIQAGTSLGREAKSFMDQGALVPDSVVIGLIGERVKQADCASGFILDGFPRTIPQAEALDQLLTGLGRQVQRAVLFEMPDSLLVGRLSGRRTCPQDGSMYHVESARPQKDGVCDQCGTALIQRPDDHEEVISNRLKVYHRQTEPLVGYYRERQLLRPIRADQGLDQVSQGLAEVLK